MEKEFTELLHQHQGIVQKICSLYFGQRPNKEDYEQELIIQLWKAFPKFLGQSKFSTWMYRVCLNAAIDILRKERLQPRLVQLDPNSEQVIQHITKSDHTNQEKLYDAILKLSDIDKAIITLYLDEYSYTEIAEIVGITPSNTGVKINRIKAELIKTINHGN